MKTSLTQKELILIANGPNGLNRYVDYRMPKKHIMLFIEHALRGEQPAWLAMANEVVAHDKQWKRERLLKELGI